VHRAWLAARADKTAALALAWAREQVRLGLQGVIEATPPSARGVLSLPAETPPVAPSFTIRRQKIFRLLPAA